ncbi:MAG: protein translocase subunit SecF [Nanoarchaeota archaeon]
MPENLEQEHKSTEQKIEEKVEEKKERKKLKEHFKNADSLYNKYYLILLIIPVILLALTLMYLTYFSFQNGDIIKKDITLTGGTSIQVHTNTDITKLRTALEDKFEDISVREVSDIITGEQVAFIIETASSPEEVKPFLEEYLGIKLTNDNSSIEFTGSALSGSFYNQLRIAILIAFILMALAVFLIFRTFAPSVAVVFAAFSDIVMTIAVVDLLGIKMSTAGIVAILMLIGYSVDTDILLTTRVIKRHEGSVNSRVWSSFKTGITMTLAALSIVIIGLIFTSSFSSIFNQIFTVLTIGLLFDILNTWAFNASFIKWYVERRNK